MTVKRCPKCGDPECVGLCTGDLHRPKPLAQHLAERGGLSQELCESLAEASRWSAHVRATLDAFTHKAFGYYTQPNPRLEVFAHGLLALASSHKQALEHATRLSERVSVPTVINLEDDLARSDIHIAALKDHVADFKAELISWLKHEVLRGGCSCNGGLECFTCQARRRLPQIYDCAHDAYPEIRALAKDKDRT